MRVSIVGLLLVAVKAAIPEDTENSKVDYQDFAAFDLGFDS